MVKTNRRLHHRQAELGGDAVDHARRRDSTHHPAAQAALLEQIAEDEAEDAVGINELAARVHRADAVGVAVGRQPGVPVARAHGRSQQPQVFGNWLRVDAAEARVHLVAQVDNVGSGAHEHLADRPPTRSVHGVVHDAQLPFVDDIEVDERPQMLVVGPGGVELDDALGTHRFVQVHQARRAAVGLVVGQQPLDLAVLLRAGAAAEARLELNAVVARGVVAGGDHHAGGGLLVDDSVADGRRGCIGPRQPRFDVVGSHDPRHFGGVAVGQEARIEADDDAWLGRALVVDEIGDSLGDQAQIVKGELVADDGSPAIGAEFDGHVDSPEIVVSDQ